MISHGRRQNLTYSVAEDIGIAIVTGSYSKKNPFPVEGKLCKQYGVSRSVLREAVKLLTAKGLLGSRPRQGTWVQEKERWNRLDPDVLRWILEQNFSFSLLIEFTELRLAVEPKAAALAAVAAGPAQRKSVLQAIHAMIESERLEEDPLEPDIGFHVAIMRASGNMFYAQLGELIETALRFSIRMTNRYKGVHRASVNDHKKISDAVLAGDAAAAEAATQYLIQEALDLINKAEDAALREARPRGLKLRA